jgi:hypothetical protein
VQLQAESAYKRHFPELELANQKIQFQVPARSIQGFPTNVCKQSVSFRNSFHSWQRSHDESVLIMGTQSADVERVCKAHKVIHTKVRNRLKSKTVYKLLYCYVNLRLLGKIDEDDTMTNFLEQAILDNIELEEEDDEDEDDEDDEYNVSPSTVVGMCSSLDCVVRLHL